MSTNQSSTCVSTSVQDGLVSQSIPTVPRPVEIRSAKIAGPLDAQVKKAWKLGDCQCVIPGIIRSISSIISL